jgi:hypothetical protein
VIFFSAMILSVEVARVGGNDVSVLHLSVKCTCAFVLSQKKISFRPINRGK